MEPNGVFDYLDTQAERLKGTESDEGFWVLSQGERLYVALAANRPDLLAADGFTITKALARLGGEWLAVLINRWQYR